MTGGGLVRVRRTRRLASANSWSGSDFDARVKVDLTLRPAGNHRAVSRAGRPNAIGLHTAKMELNGSLDASEGRIDRLACGHAPRQVWNRGTPVTTRILVDSNEIPDLSHHLPPFSPPTAAAGSALCHPPARAPSLKAPRSQPPVTAQRTWHVRAPEARAQRGGSHFPTHPSFPQAPTKTRLFLEPRLRDSPYGEGCWAGCRRPYPRRP